MTPTSYNYQNILDAYEKVGVSSGKTVLVHSDLRGLGAYEAPGKKAVLEGHLKAIKTLLGSKGTIVVPAGSQNLCNTDIPFDPAQTPSSDLGVFSEFVRQQEGALRAFHPFVSYAAIGPQAKAITENTSRHAWGALSTKARLVEMDALSLSVGLTPNWSCSTIHHAEQMSGVPYRYIKEFLHPVVRGGELRIEPFYQNLCYQGVKLERNRNVNLMNDFTEAGYGLNEANFGLDQDISSTSMSITHKMIAPKVWSYSMAELFESFMKSLEKDIYRWLSASPDGGPWRE